MHQFTLEQEVVLGPNDIIKPGEYVGETIFAAQLIVMAGGGTMRPLNETRVPVFDGVLTVRRNNPDAYSASDGMPCTSILIGRTGGLGDLTLLTPVLREIKRRWPSVKLAVACIRELGQSIQNLPFIDEILDYPVPLAKAQEYDGWLWLENCIEKNEYAKTLHSVDVVAKFIGLDLPEGTDKLQAYVVTEKERQGAQWAYPRINGTRRLCVQVGASAKCRVYPMQKTGEVVAAFLKDGWEVFLLGAPGEIKMKDHQPGLRVVADGVTFRQRCAILETADAFFGPDSSLLHVAGALSVPAVGLYGPFPWQVRTAYCPTTVTLSHRAGYPCSPCFHHSHMRNEFPANCPTRDKGYCGVLADIKPQQIIDKLLEIARGGDEKVVGFPQEIVGDTEAAEKGD